MKKMQLLWLLAAIMFPALLVAQQPSAALVKERTFPVEGYTVFKMGYPLMVAGAGDGTFMYIEFWEAGKQEHKTRNFYLQKYGIPDYGELWFRPLTYEGYEQMPEVFELMKLEKNYVVFGRQYIDNKKYKIVGRWYDSEGKSPALEPNELFKFDKISGKDLQHKFMASPSEKYMMWWASDGGGRNYAAVWSSIGVELWKKEIKTPYGSNYVIRESVVDDKGNPTFLMVSSKQSFNLKDTANAPIILHYNVKEDKYTSEKVNLGKTFFINGHLQLVGKNKNEVIVTGICSNGIATDGIVNGSKTGGEVRPWTNIYMSRINLDSMWTLADSVCPIPLKWQEKYTGEGGSNFTDYRLIIEGNMAVLAFEEHYVAGDKNLFFDIGVLGVNIEDCSTTWGQIVAKKQRDNGNGDFLSYTTGKYKGKVHFIYISEMGASGKLMATSIDAKTGKSTEKVFITNEESKYYFFPSRSHMVSDRHLILIGPGNPTQNAYKLMTIAFQ
jgi:hypothetical protein